MARRLDRSFVCDSFFTTTECCSHIVNVLCALWLCHVTGCSVTLPQVDDRDSGTASDDDLTATNSDIVEMLMLHSLSAAAAAAAAGNWLSFFV